MSTSFSASNYSQDPALKKITDKGSCACCGKVTKKVLKCGACKSAEYCSKDCQRKHWKEHKPRCKAIQGAKEKATDVGHRKEFKLLQQWKDQVRSGIMFIVLMDFFGYEVLSKLQETKDVILLDVVFDYNKRTFLPLKPPSIVPCDDALGFNQQILSAYQMMAGDANSDKKANFVVLLMCRLGQAGGGGKDLASLMPFTMEEPETPRKKRKWEDSLLLLDRIQLQSSRFDPWLQITNMNLKKQLEVVERHPQFQPFLVNALRIETKKSDQRYKTHIVVVYMTMGRGLGEIKSLAEFKVQPVSQVIDNISTEFQGKLSPQELDRYKTEYFDLENSPRLLQSRIARPKNALLPVLCVCKGVCLYVMPNMMEVFDDHDIRAASKCDKKAQQAFLQLRNAKFPSIQSPELH